MNTTTAINSDSFLRDVALFRVEDGVVGPDSPIVEAVLAAQKPCIKTHEDCVLLGIPVFNGSELTSIAVLTGKSKAAASGVFEIWSPEGQYQDLRLTAGYFGHLERFQNVSSYVRFESGAGLPGQAAKLSKAILHDELSEHPGFLRAAGASAGELQTALALPIFSPQFQSCVLLISSRPTPIAACIETWRCDGDEWSIDSVAVAPTNEIESPPESGTELRLTDSPIWPEISAGQAVLCQESTQLAQLRGVSCAPISDACLALPTFANQQLQSLSVLWL